jgi:hypothetical protein
MQMGVMHNATHAIYMELGDNILKHDDNILVVTAYLYGTLDTDIYMRIPAGLVEFQNSQRRLECLKLERALYGLKQAGRMWYKRLRDFLID